MKKFTGIAILIFFTFLSVSCIGISTDIKIKKDGSGRITLEYRYARKMETIGRLDGNENWPIIPVGKKDMERTAARIEGLNLVSYSSRETASQKNAEKDILTTVTLDFKTVQALLDFLAPSPLRQAQGTAFIQNGSTNTLSIIFIEPVSSSIDPDLMNLLRDMSEGYQFKFTFSAENNINLIITDGEGKAIAAPPEAQIISEGKKVLFTLKTTDFFNYQQGLGLSISW